MKSVVRATGTRAVAAGLLAAALAGVGGCAVRAEYDPPAYYYRTRLVYTAWGPTYVRERVYVAPAREEVVYAPSPPPAAPPPAPESAAAADLNPLVSPIALYPDPLVAVLLPAATFPQQVRDAKAWLAANPAPPQEAIDAQPWDPSVKALCHYPTVLARLAADGQWTESLGSAFTEHPADVMAAIQQMRAQAAAQGSLVDSPQQVIVREEGVIAIEPADPAVIYVPEYDPVVVYAGCHPLVFGEVACATGPWFVNGCYWGGGVIFVGDWHGGFLFHDGHWGRDYGWRAERFHHWARDARFGPPPRVDRAHYALAREVRGHEAEIHRTMAAHAAQRQEVRRQEVRQPSRVASASGAARPGYSPAVQHGARGEARRGSEERDGGRR